MQYFHGTNIDFVGKRKIFFIVSATIIILGMITVLSLGVDYGIDFEGGTEIAVAFSEPINTQEIRDVVEGAGFAGSEIKTFGEDNQFLIRIKEAEEAPVIIQNSLQNAFPNQEITTLKVDKIDARIGSELQFQAFIAILLSVLVILIYIGFRFEFTFGLGAIVALIHDVLFAIVVIVVVNKLGIVNLEINQGILAAMLTVVGYSINDTVIVFDRVRENREVHKGMNVLKLVNLSINETLSRTVNTVATTVLVLMTIVLFGGPVLQGFAFTMLVGILVGTYSSIFIASPFVIWYLDKVKKIDVDKGFNKSKVGVPAKI